MFASEIIRKKEFFWEKSVYFATGSRRNAMKYILLALSFLILQISRSWAQADTAAVAAADTVITKAASTNIPSEFQFPITGSQLPPDLLHTKSVVFVDIIGESGTSGGNWKKLAREIHPAFGDMGIDAVAYYYWQDANAGPDAAQKLAKELNQRYIENIIYLAYDQSSKEYLLLMAPFDTENPFVDRQKGAFQLVAATPTTLIRQLDNRVRRSGIEKENFLVIDVPEFFVGAGNIIRGNRAEGFAQDLKLDKLAVPRFGTEQDSALAQIMEPYPYEYALVDPERDEEELRQEGFQFILLNLHTQEATIREMLGYPDTNQASGKKPAQSPRKAPAPPGRSVYKFYVKHIYTGDVYVGDTWDASVSWRSALTNYLRYMKEDMNIGK